MVNLINWPQFMGRARGNLNERAERRAGLSTQYRTAQQPPPSGPGAVAAIAIAKLVSTISAVVESPQSLALHRWSLSSIALRVELTIPFARIVFSLCKSAELRGSFVEPDCC